MKNLLKNILVPVLASRPISAVATRIFGSGIPVFMLHRTATDESSSQVHSVALLRQYLQFLKDNGHNFVSIMDIFSSARGDITLPPKPVAFTIDDGYLHQAEIAAPVFLEFDCPVTIFLITGFLDEELWPWFSQVTYLLENCTRDSIDLDILENTLTLSTADDESRSLTKQAILETMKITDDENIPVIIDKLSHATQVKLPLQAPEKYRPMTWDTARDLEKKGISFGPHTISHPILSRVNNHKSEYEITRSWQRLNEEITNPVPIFCYPNGRPCDYSKREIDIIRKAGLIGAVTTIQKQVDMASSDDLYEYNLPRLNFPQSLVDLIQYSTWIEHAKYWR